MDVLTELSELELQYRKVRDYSLTICDDLEIEDYVAQPASFVSPPKWHLAHTTWFFETFVLKPYLDHYSPFHPKFAYIFNSYYQHAGERALRENRGSLTRPTVQEIKLYRTYVDQAMQELLQSSKALIEEVKNVITLGLQHEQQHQELLVYDIKFILGHNPLYPSLRLALPTLEQIGVNKYLNIHEGLYDIGHADDSFHFDNEKPRHQVFIPESVIASELVSNEQVVEFIEAGGYQNFGYWLDEGWTWVQQHEIKAPLYWQKINNVWHQYRLLNGLQPVQKDHPVMHISFYEADAIARFFGYELPSEFQREAVWDQLESAQLWEWSSSAYRPYPGFKAEKGALGEYNGKFMVNQMVLRGGSIASPPMHIRSTYRNFFHPNERWMFSGIRFLKHL